ncbi:tonB dependent receptor domain-containing protein [Ditylenchus destructor]|uniref:TonB dependent receptor domain-containing protein n=1 Tax=Ditylenchus destructor TaxID=166010 RepID=A0AAD4ME72_9BILA|nr:tonB dependent receptor domain-containing protein [Ditylenchus destructor]
MCALMCVAAPAAEAQSAARFRFALPRQDLSLSLEAVATITRTNIVFLPSAARGRVAPALNGTYTAAEALRRLLSGSELAFTVTAGGSYDVVVTGSRIDLLGFEAPTPTSHVTRPDLETGGRANVAAALNDLPQFRGTISPQTSGTNTSAGMAPVDLRGLGINRTLVLLDGRRFSSDNDLNTIPMVLIKSVDIVTGGASAAWGSGAVAGVVNVVLDGDLRGIRLGAQAGISSRGDAAERRFEGAFGTAFADGRGKVILGVEYLDNEGVIPKVSRPSVGRWSSVAAGNGNFLLTPDVGFANAARGGLILSGILAGQVFDPDGSLRDFRYGTVVGTDMIGGEGPSNDDLSALVTPQRRYSALGRVTFRPDASVKVRAELRHSRMWNDYIWFGDHNRGNISIARDNAFLSPEISARLLAAGEPASRWAGSIRLPLPAHRFRTGDDAGNDRARRGAGDELAPERLLQPWRVSQRYRHAGLRDRRQLQPGRGCGAGSGDGPAGLPRQADRPIEHVHADQSVRRRRTSAEALAYVTGDAAPARHDQAGCRRYQPARRAGDARRRACLHRCRDRGAARGDPADGKRSRSGPRIPVVQLRARHRRLHRQRAVRRGSRPAGARSAAAAQAGAERGGAPVRLRHHGIDLVLEAGRHERLTVGYNTLTDPLKNVSVYVLNHTGGNPYLRPETATTFTAGFLYAPPGISGLRLWADYYRVRIDDVITTVSAQDLVIRCFNGNQALCANVERDAGGNITRTLTSYLNLSEYRTDGIDAELSQTLPFSRLAGLPRGLTFRLPANWVNSLKTNDGVTTIEYVRSQGNSFSLGVPKWRVNASIGYDGEGFGAQLRARYISPGNYNSTIKLLNNHIPAYAYLDISARVRVAAGPRRKMEIYGNVTNLLDRQAPNGSLYSPFYDVVGRHFSAGARLSTRHRISNSS